VRDFIREWPDVTVSLVSTIDDAHMNQAYIAYRRIEDLPYLLGEQLAERLDIEGTPYALRIDRDGTVLAKGIVNTFENLAIMRQQRAGVPGVGPDPRQFQGDALVHSGGVR